MVAQERINAHETVGRKKNCKLNFFSMYFVWNNEEMHLSYSENSEKIADTSFQKTYPKKNPKKTFYGKMMQKICTKS